MSAEKWRLLNLGETIQEGDQWHDHKTNLWAYAHQGVGDAVQTIDGPVRRRMTPAEAHANDLAVVVRGWLEIVESLPYDHMPADDVRKMRRQLERVKSILNPEVP